MARTPTVGLFIPCYVDQLAPEVGLATTALLDELGISFVVPRDPTCCGQPFLSAGALPQAQRLAAAFAKAFDRFDHVVMPSGSCAATLRTHLAELVDDPDAAALAGRTYELCQYLVEVVGAAGLTGRLDARLGMHASCHALRGIRLGHASELRSPPTQDPARVLLEGLAGVQWVELSRRDECCGFGGVFCVDQPEVSGAMARDRVEDHQRAGAQIVTSTDVSCLAHMRRIAAKTGSALRFLHVAQLLADRDRAPGQGGP